MKYNVNLQIKAIPNNNVVKEMFNVEEYKLSKTFNLEAEDENAVKRIVNYMLDDFEQSYDAKIYILKMIIEEEDFLNTSKGHKQSLINTFNKLWKNKNKQSLFQAILKAYAFKYNIDMNDYKDFDDFAYKLIMYSCDDGDLFDIIKFVDKK